MGDSKCGRAYLVERKLWVKDLGWNTLAKNDTHNVAALSQVDLTWSWHSTWIWFSCSSVLISQRNHLSTFDNVWSFNSMCIHHKPYRNYTSPIARVVSSVLLPDVICIYQISWRVGIKAHRQGWLHPASTYPFWYHHSYLGLRAFCSYGNNKKIHDSSNLSSLVVSIPSADHHSFMLVHVGSLWFMLVYLDS